MATMKQSRVSYDYFMAVGIQGGSLTTMVTVVKEFFFHPRQRRPSSWLIMLWLVVSLLYTLAVPSLLNATTGYMVPSEAFWMMPDSSMTPDLVNATKACFLVQDGSRIGLPNNTVISGPSWPVFAGPMYSTIEFGGECQNAAPDYPLFNNITNCKIQQLLPGSC
jgi:hypothetical protein